MEKNKNYFYESYPEALKEIEVILNEMEISFKEQRFFTTIILCGAINERLLTEKLIGHSKVLFSNTWQPGWKFFVDNKWALLDDKDKKEEFVRKIDAEMHGNPLKWNQIRSLFDIDISFKKKFELSKKIGIGQDDQKKVLEIHKKRVQYFHPFKLPNINLDIRKDAEEIRKLIRELLKDFYGIFIQD